MMIDECRIKGGWLAPPFVFLFCILHSSFCIPATAEPRPVPRAQVVPQPYDQVSFQRDGHEIARYHFGHDLRRPFVFPLIGPSGRSLTRMGHPHDPETHSHHNSVWVAHNDVDGVSFWDDRAKGRIVQQRVELLEDGFDPDGKGDGDAAAHFCFR